MNDVPSPPKHKVNYDQLASTYNQRFQDNERSGTAVALRALALDLCAQLGRTPRILEVGCGTGRWLAELAAVSWGTSVCGPVYGLDLSTGMLKQAQSREADLRLVRGRAGRLPCAAHCFDLVYAVNAIHHFWEPRAFVAEARRMLRPGGRLAVIGMDPHARRESWYVYRYFEGVYETDLERFPSWQEIETWMVEEGLQEVTCRVIERIWNPLSGRAVLDDPFIRHGSSSQLALLSQEAYHAGLRRIEDALGEAEARGETLLFPVDNPLAMIVGYRPPIPQSPIRDRPAVGTEIRQ
jgi:ubiquinone/menaquinone biosynthesis C-methylase UbiE